MTCNNENTMLYLLKNSNRKTVDGNSSAFELYNELSCRIPFPIREFADRLGLIIDEEEFRFTQSGRLRGTNITVNSIHKEYRKNFTIAHEIAHFLLNHGNQEIEYVNRDSEANYTPEQLVQEQEADDIAAEILISEQSFSQDVKQYLKEHNLDKLNEQHAGYITVRLAEKYSVSKQSIILRLKNLGYINKWAWINA